MRMSWGVHQLNQRTSQEQGNNFSMFSGLSWWGNTNGVGRGPLSLSRSHLLVGCSFSYSKFRQVCMYNQLTYNNSVVSRLQSWTYYEKIDPLDLERFPFRLSWMGFLCDSTLWHTAALRHTDTPRIWGSGNKRSNTIYQINRSATSLPLHDVGFANDVGVPRGRNERLFFNRFTACTYHN